MQENKYDYCHSPLIEIKIAQKVKSLYCLTSCKSLIKGFIEQKE